MPEATKSRSRVQREPSRRHGLRLLEEVGGIIAHASDLRASVQGIVETIAQRLSMEVCSLYTYDPSEQLLTLFATTGLDPSSVGRVAMGIGEGLTGIVIQKMEPVMAIDAMAHPRYKYFPETGEERYHSFLGVPVVDQRQPRGVLIVQTSRRRRFTRDEVRLLKAIAVPVAGILAQTRLRASLESKEEERRSLQKRMVDAIDRLKAYETQTSPRPATAVVGATTRLIGLGASPGFGIGRAYVLDSQLSAAGVAKKRRQSAKREIGRLRAATARSIEELLRSKERIQRTVPEIDMAMFDAQQLMLQDLTFLRRMEALITEGLSAEAALEQTVHEFVARFAEMKDSYFVLVAADIALSDLALIEQGDLRAVLLASGGVTSHTSILAKSLEIPTVVGVDRAEEVIHEGDELIVDGNAGIIFVNPAQEILREYDRLEREYRAFNRDLESLRDLPAETLDGHRVRLCANVGLLGDLNLARLHGAEGIGLYRTEVPFLSHRDFLSEAEQVHLYQRVVEGMAGKPVTVRTLDLGADKYPRYFNVPREDNPFLGWRSIRISLELPELFKVQLRAILRASAAGPMRIMFPMISSLEEIRRAKELLAEAQEELRAAGQPFDPNPAVGMMVEVPSAVCLAEHFVREVDFFSIGTNDLIQYVLAVDRNNRKVAPLYEPLHPAVIQFVARAVSIATQAGKQVSICGEMAADPVCTLLLVGLGFHELSMGPFFIPVIKRLIRGLSFETAQRLAKEVLTLPSIAEVKSRIFETMRQLGVIDIMEMYH